MNVFEKDEFSVPEIDGRRVKHAQIQAAQSASALHGDDRTTPTDSVAQYRNFLVKVSIKFLSSLTSQLVELRNGPEADDFGILRPVLPAYESACNLVIGAAVELTQSGTRMPNGRVSTDSEGGVRIEWVRETASVHLIVPAGEGREGYIYHEEGTIYGTEPSTPDALAQWLRIIKD